MLLAVVGDLVEDVVVWPDGPVVRGTDTQARVFRARGGSAANVAVAAVPFTPVRFLGCVGADPLGDQLVAELAQAGVDVRTQRRGRTGTVVVLVDGDGERTFLPDRAAAADLAQLAAADLDGVDLLHVPAYGLHGGRTATTVRDLLDSGVPVSLDTSSVAVLQAIGVEAFRDLVQRTRPVVLFANADEARTLDLAARPLTGTTVVRKDGAQPTVVTRPDGSCLVVPVEPVEGVRDSTGAGDAFAAGWLSARADGLDDRARVLRAHDLARRVLATPGAGSHPQEHP